MTYATDVSPIVVDVETCGLDNAADFLEPVQPDSRLKDPEKIRADIEAKTAGRWEKLALDWNVGRIVALGWCVAGFNSPDQPIVDIYQCRICRNEAEERDAIEYLWNLARHRTIVGFNIKGFDLRFLVQRSRYLGIAYPQLDFGKYSRKGISDLYLDLTFGDGHYDQGAMRRTLKMFCRRFGIPVPDETDGKEVPALVAAGDWEAIAAHCRADVELTVALARKLGVVQVQPEMVP